MALAPADLIQTIESLSFRALPALEQRYYDGWLLRLSRGYTGRANSINPIYNSSEDLQEKIDLCESIYSDNELPTIFKLTSAMQPVGLETILEQNGYRLRDEVVTQVMTAQLSDLSSVADALDVQTKLHFDWLNAYMQMNAVPSRHHDTLKHILKLIAVPCGFALLRQDDENVAVALGVLDGDWIGIYDVVVASEHRRKGYARVLMDGLLAWGKSQGAKQAYLQVVSNNTPAVNLYQSLGFVHAYDYWYRIKDL